jgi:hypothetical protein
MAAETADGEPGIKPIAAAMSIAAVAEALGLGDGTADPVET